MEPTDRPEGSRERQDPFPPDVAGAPFRPSPMLEVLARHQIKFVLIGGLAGRYLGSPTQTTDLDICYERSRPNLVALADALRELGAYLRGVEPGLPFQLDAQTIQNGDSFTFVTKYGDLDILGTPRGTEGYPDLIRKAEVFELGSARIDVVSLDDLIRMKRAAGRAKDRVELEILGALREEIDRQEESGRGSGRG